MNKYKLLNLIKRIPLFPFIVIWRIFTFVLSPLFAVVAFFVIDWESQCSRNFWADELKDAISFGLRRTIENRIFAIKIKYQK